MNKTSHSQDGYLFLLNYQNLTGNSTEAITNNQFIRASTRLQLAPALKAAKSLNQSSRTYSLLTESFDLIEELGNPNACIFSKIGSDKPRSQKICITTTLAIAARMKARGTPIATLYSDNHISENSWRGHLYRDLLNLSDFVIYPSQALQNQANQFIQIKAKQFIVEDICCLKRESFKKINPNEIINLIWFGHPSNIQYAINQLPRLIQYKSKHRILLKFLTTKDINQKIAPIFASLKNQCDWEFRLVDWDHKNQPNQLQNELSSAHICWIPSNHNDPRKAGASHNRLVDAVNAGCITIASPLQSYEELSDIAMIGYDYASSLHNAINNNGNLIREFESKRDNILSRFEPRNNFKKWKKILKTISGTNSRNAK